MTLTLYINDVSIKQWPLYYPEKNPFLSDEQNYNKREYYIQDMIEQAKKECSELIQNNSNYHFFVNVRARVQPKDIEPENNYRSCKKKLDIEDIPFVIMDRPPTAYSNVKSLYKA